MQILFVIAALVLLFMIVRLLLRTPKTPRPQQAPKVTSRRMLRCDHCGLHVPENEAVREGNKHFCCPDHRDMALSKQSTRD
ncbi:uncharacterized protein SAMN05216526_0677 [Ectothiorhodosinus mongolicus]|uniref:Preprotein translocase subunit YajC n=1 Tax=Ectothiorhodosinus mongolicus TaxID=233100 RepID=A0A1R3VQ36_9GAMM|nr:PP0621 family protein [Ectothiorhodosinus mongolicus]ULX56666.1 hypothetical protein CKX93_02445 [Ectothiorhodosinus mongolicus]SIT66722.1 uncharacterized protein SAMN05216526_0677 [Ectothiorhodosinus mongolicus]